MRRAVAVLVAVGLTLAGCGFLNSGERGSSKPDGFTLRGYVSVGPAPGGASAPTAASAAGDPGAAGTPCRAPAGAADVQAGGAVRVADTEGHTLAAGELSPGVRGAGRCNFGFQIVGVPGGVDRYVVGIGNRPAVIFPAQDLRSDKPAVIVVDI